MYDVSANVVVKVLMHCNHITSYSPTSQAAWCLRLYGDQTLHNIMGIGKLDFCKAGQMFMFKTTPHKYPVFCLLC